MRIIAQIQYLSELNNIMQMRAYSDGTIRLCQMQFGGKTPKAINKRIQTPETWQGGMAMDMLLEKLGK